MGCKADRGPWDEPVGPIGNTGQRVVPRHECREKAEESAGFDDRQGGLSVGGFQVADAEEEEGEIEEEEQEEEGEGGAQGAHEKDGREDPPSLYLN